MGIVRMSIPSSSFAAIFPVSHDAGIYRERHERARYLQSALERPVFALRLQILVICTNHLLLSLSFNTNHVALHLDIDTVLRDSGHIANNNELRIRLDCKFFSMDSNFNDINAHMVSIRRFALAKPKASLQHLLFQSRARNGSQGEIVVFKVRV